MGLQLGPSLERPQEPSPPWSTTHGGLSHPWLYRRLIGIQNLVPGTQPQSPFRAYDLCALVSVPACLSSGHVRALGGGCYPRAQSQFGLLFLSLQASSGASSRADPCRSCRQGCSHGAVLGLGLWGLVEDVGPPSPPQPPSLSIASPVPPWPLDAQGGPWLPEPPLSLTVDTPSDPPQ